MQSDAADAAADFASIMSDGSNDGGGGGPGDGSGSASEQAQAAGAAHITDPGQISQIYNDILSGSYRIGANADGSTSFSYTEVTPDNNPISGVNGYVGYSTDVRNVTVNGDPGEVYHYLNPSSVTFKQQGPSGENGDYYYANINSISIVFHQYNGTPESGNYGIRLLPLKIKPFSVGLPVNSVLGVRGAQMAFADAFDDTIFSIYESFREGLINEKSNVTQIFYDRLYLNLQDAGGGSAYESHIIQNIPISSPTFTTHPNH